MILTELSPQKFHRFVLYEDNHLLVVRKPAGLLVQGDRSGRANLLDLAKEYLKIKYHKPGRVFLGLVHRLDRQAAGVMVLARTTKSAGRLSAQFREHTVKKIYWAVIQGSLSPPAGRLEMHLARNGDKIIPAQAGSPRTQSARLSYRTLETGAGASPPGRASLVEVDLETGRRHQVRVQLSALGHPIVGDVKYGSLVEPRLDSTGLLSRSLTLVHPTQGHQVTFEAPPPPDWPWLPLDRLKL